ncbi:PilW family protein [methane-oxidizing endosymbiont of Gigantopelta aegis]|uniref:PilW family protein n=1 Tax=methane-oxidizing endosymbiont of Gigantopelta aegis TaxID=2794938 RepID=UPI0018DC59FA|nr:PilW family protein [methane-oxidizing endosymbiont of Gigantopelta aegis]
MKYKQSGFTLIELMIGLLLGMALIAGVVKVFIDSGNSFRKQKTLSYLVEDGRYVMEVLAREFRRAGFLRNRYAAGGTADSVFIPDSGAGSNGVLDSGIDLAGREYIKGDFNKDGFEDAYDINHVVFRYQLNDSNDLAFNNPNYALSPCTRNIHLTDGEDPVNDKIVVTIYFYVALDSTNTPVLYCKAKRENLDDSSKNKTSSAVTLISNVEKLFVLYGHDKDGDGFANQYLRADQVDDQVDPFGWEKIVSVRLYLVLASEEKNVVLKTPGYTLDGRSYTVNAPDDKRLYKVFSTTIALRNDEK